MRRIRRPAIRRADANQKVKAAALEPLGPGERPEIETRRLPVDFAPFHGQGDFGAALVAGNDPHVEAKQFPGQGRQLVQQRAATRGRQE